MPLSQPNRLNRRPRPAPDMVAAPATGWIRCGTSTGAHERLTGQKSEEAAVCLTVFGLVWFGLVPSVPWGLNLEHARWLTLISVWVIPKVPIYS